MSHRSSAGRFPSHAARIVLALALVLILATLPGGCRSREESGGQAAPYFTLPDLAGNQVSLDSLRGRPVLLNFWGTT